ncbi:hypothetical protein F2P44_32720 [Massilia sp. CCM 8695]|uniref:DUF2167 domain-containing protein n=1 Tax=Massilia frigida TaxID=2609281 RepID=A0ABX0NJC2_9BURK|nr:hypothetical protein [Massilia frigida]NHZ83991.1 hypothetical protein [Massilia frigida]
MSEKAALKVVSNDDEALVIDVADGKTDKYYRNPIRTFSLEVFELQMHRSATVYRMSGEIEPLPVPTRHLRGSASMGRSKLAVIGAPCTATSVVPISFSVLSEAQRLSAEQNAEEYKQPLRHTGVTVGFIEADWEIGNGDDWFVECYVSAEVFAEMENAVAAGTLKKASIGLDLDNIYTNDNYAPPSVSADWFIKPNLENPKYGADMARGDITSFNLALTSIWLGPPPEAAPRDADDTEQHGYQSQPAVSAEAIALDKLGANIEKLRGTVKWVGGFIAVFLLFLVMKGS